MDKIQKKNNKLNNLLKWFLVVILLLIIIPLTGCDNNKQSKHINTPNVSIVYEVQPVEDSMSVTYTVSVRNQTIYNIKSFDYQLNVYNEGHLIRKVDVEHFDQQKIWHGLTFNIKKMVMLKGIDFDEIKVEATNFEFQSFGKTYFVPILVMSIIAVIASVIYIIACFSECFDMDIYVCNIIISIILIIVLFLIIAVILPLIWGHGRFYYFDWVNFVIVAIAFVVYLIATLIGTLVAGY